MERIFSDNNLFMLAQDFWFGDTSEKIEVEDTLSRFDTTIRETEEGIEIAGKDFFLAWNADQLQYDDLDSDWLHDDADGDALASAGWGTDEDYATGDYL